MQLAQRQANQRAHLAGVRADLLRGDLFRHGHVVERVEIISRDVQFFFEESVGVGNHRTAAGQQQQCRLLAALLAAVKID